MWTQERGGQWVVRLVAILLWAIGLMIFTTLTQAHEVVDATDPHAHHHHQVSAETTRSTANYTLPDLKLVRDDGRAVRLADEINDGRAVVLTFIYTSCTTVCPMTSHTLAQLQKKLGAARDLVHVMSISIDPEQDTPQRLREYAKSYSAGPDWQHYTGSLAASQTAQRAFDVYRGNKMNHQPAMFVRVAPDAPWVRLDGFATADQLLAELATTVRAAR